MEGLGKNLQQTIVGQQCGRTCNLTGNSENPKFIVGDILQEFLWGFDKAAAGCSA